MTEDHFRKLERMYLAAPVNQEHYPSSTIRIDPGSCEIRLEVDESYFHGGKALHGSVYFKLMDDACYFAVASSITDRFLVTSEFSLQFTRPVFEDTLICKAEFTGKDDNQYFARAILYNREKKVVGKGEGIFVKSRLEISSEYGYR